MKISLKWLREYVDITLPADELAAMLTASGNEVGGIVRKGGSWNNVQVAQVARIEPHPNADRLRLATVDLGGGREKTVVCGAPNIAAGQKVAFASVGAVLIDGHSGETAELKAARIRGVVSEGMVCSEKELGLSDAHEGILVLPDDAPIGVPLDDYLGDTVLDIDVTPNRPDCYSVVGVAREVAVLTGQTLREPDRSYAENGPGIQGQVDVEIADPDLCYRYTASLVKGVKIGPSPGWMQERLAAAGMRPINNVVDITNYVMLEVGQPLHSFDYHQVRDRKIVVRRARPGEPMTTLDGVTRAFSGNMLMICDGRGPVALGGIIGGADSEITDQTVDILLESANFNHVNIRQTESALRVRTEASARFDKGLHQDSAVVGLQRATKLLVELCDGVAAHGIVDAYPARREPVTVNLTQRRLRTILGADLSIGQVNDILTALGCRVVEDLFEPEGSSEPERPAGAGEWEPDLPTGQAGLQVTPPWWRPDLTIPDDLCEEVARIIGYDNLPTTSIKGAVPHHEPDPVTEVKERLRDLLMAAGMQEVITYSLTSQANLQRLSPLPAVTEVQAIKVTNPMSAEQEYLRTTIRASLLTTLAANERTTSGNFRLFEVGRIYLPRPDDLPEEREIAAGVFAGSGDEPHWESQARPVDFYDAKGILEAVFERLGIEVAFQSADDANLHPGRTAALTVDSETVGVLGELHPEVAERFDISSRPVYLFELDVQTITAHVRGRRRYRSISRFPSVTEDLAVVVDISAPAADIEHAIRDTPLVTAARLFDVYAGSQVPAGKRSLAFSVTYQAPDHTLSGDEVSSVRQSIIQRLRAEFGTELRQ